MALASENLHRPCGEGDSLESASDLPISKVSDCLTSLKLEWKKKNSIGGILHEWADIAGSQLAEHCQPISFKNRILVIGANHPQWRQALQYNKPQLVAAIKAAGHPIKDLRIQQYYPNKIKPSESELNIWGRHPSRIDIHGMSNCNYCGSPAPTGEMALWGKCGFCRRKDLALNTSE